MGGGVACPYLEEGTEEGYKWSCGLMRKYKSWSTVHETEEYKKNVQPIFEKLGIKKCGEYTCENCI